jgi:predicted Fe-Mo cluster-binding NifX family protein
MNRPIRVAVASDDGATVAPHLGHSSRFLIYELKEERFVPTESRPNVRQHDRIAATLHDCRFVLAGSEGMGPAAELTTNGIIVLEAPSSCEVGLAMSLFISGALMPPASHACRQCVCPNGAH